jgi:flavorubredoxin
MFDDLTSGAMVQANQHLIIDGPDSMLLDPGGHKVYSKLFAEVSSILPPGGLKYILFSHQDPDIVASANGWLMVTDAQAFASSLWMRFIPHFGIDDYVVHRLVPVDDCGRVVPFHGGALKLLPAHFLHSPGNLQVYDPISKILYSGDLGASLGHAYQFVEDFDKHIQYMKGFHQRYMPSSRALKAWAAMARTLDIEMIAPQHGAIMGSKPIVSQFIDWIDQLVVGVELIEGSYRVPE